MMQTYCTECNSQYIFTYMYYHIKINQMYVNIPYMDDMGIASFDACTKLFRNLVISEQEVSLLSHQAG